MSKIKNKKKYKSIKSKKQKLTTFTVWTGQHKSITCNLTKNKK